MARICRSISAAGRVQSIQPSALVSVRVRLACEPCCGEATRSPDPARDVPDCQFGANARQTAAE